MPKYRFLLACASAGVVASAASAQQAPLYIGGEVVPSSDDRGRNVSVLQRDRPEYRAIGIRTGSFFIYPRLDLQAGVTNNVYQTASAKQTDGFVGVNPSLSIRSNWSLHSLQFSGGANLVRYFSATERNEDGWNLGTQGKLDVSSALSVNAGVTTQRLYESRFSGAALTDVRQASPYQSTIARALINYKAARTKIVLSGDYSNLNFLPVDTFSGTTLDQDDRDRNVYRGAAHLEYELNPDAGVFGEVSYTNTDYSKSQLLGINEPNRSSDEVRALAGVSFDLTALVRGNFAVGYIDRKYDAGFYSNVSGFSFSTRIEYFLSSITTVTLSGRREIQDATQIGSSGYFATGGGFRVDHELLRNLLLNASADYEDDRYRGIDAHVRVIRAGGGAKYFVTNFLGFGAAVNYADRSPSGTTSVGLGLSELRGVLSVSVQR